MLDLEAKIKMRITKKQGGIIGGVVAVVLIAAAIGVHAHYQNRWYPGSTFNKVDVSGMTYEESVKKVKKSIDSYKLKIKGRNKGQEMISGKEIDLAFTSEEKVKEAYDAQHKKSVFSAFFGGSKTNVTAVTLSEKKLNKKLKQSVLVKGNDSYKITKPVDATITYDTNKKYGVIQKEDKGNYLNRKEFYNATKRSVESLSKTLNLTDEKNNPDVYVKPGLYHDDEQLKQMQTTYNEYLFHFIQWDMGNGVKETLGPDALKDCITVNTKKRTVKLSQAKVEKWLESFCLKYKTQGIARTFKTHSGKKIKVSGGDYGWRIDYDKVIAQTMKALKKAPEESAIKAVDLSAQEVFVYKKGKLVFSTTCITGKATPDRITRTGVYDIKEKKLTKTLTGADYSVPTRYWTRIMWTGTGYHYSSRGDWGSWSPTYYKTNGSHGCVNLTLSDARSVYNLTKIGDPVFIHY